VSGPDRPESETPGAGSKAPGNGSKAPGSGRRAPDDGLRAPGDDESGVEAENDAGIQAKPGNPPEVEDEPEPEIDPAPHGWSRQTTHYADEPWSHLARAMGYEVLVVLVTAAAIAVLAFIALQGRFQDLYIKLRPETTVSHQVALLTIGPESLYLWDPAHPHPDTTPRAMVAEIVRFLHAADARVVVLDLLLDTPAEGDDALATAARAQGAVVVAEKLQVTEPASGRQFVADVSPTLQDAVYSGFANFQAEQNTLFSSDLVVRRVPLVHLANVSRLSGQWPLDQVGGTQDVDQVVPALSLVAATLQAHGPISEGALSRALQQGCTGRPLRCTLTASDLGLPPLPAPLTVPLPINFRGPEHADGLPTVTAARALRVNAQAALMRSLGREATIEVPDDLKKLLAGRVVVVGRVDRPDQDRFLTPYSLPVPVAPDMAGPRIHAQIIDTLLSGHHIRTVGGWGAWVLGALFALAVLLSWRLLRDDALTAVWFGVATLIVVIAVIVFDYTDGVALDIGPPLLGVLSMVFLLTLRGWAVEDSQRT